MPDEPTTETAPPAVTNPFAPPTSTDDKTAPELAQETPEPTGRDLTDDEAAASALGEELFGDPGIHVRRG